MQSSVYKGHWESQPALGIIHEFMKDIAMAQLSSKSIKEKVEFWEEVKNNL